MRERLALSGAGFKVLVLEKDADVGARSADSGQS